MFPNELVYFYLLPELFSQWINDMEYMKLALLGASNRRCLDLLATSTEFNKWFMPWEYIKIFKFLKCLEAMVFDDCFLLEKDKQGHYAVISEMLNPDHFMLPRRHRNETFIIVFTHAFFDWEGTSEFQWMINIFEENRFGINLYFTDQAKPLIQLTKLYDINDHEYYGHFLGDVVELYTELFPGGSELQYVARQPTEHLEMIQNVDDVIYAVYLF